jgi:Zn-dependent protease
VGGISIEVNASWLIVFALVWYDLGRHVFTRLAYHGGAWVPWVAAFLTTLLFFASVLLHELSHSFVARRTGIGVSRITLFVFGGVAQVDEEPRRATDELAISLAGPAMSVALAVVFGLGYLGAERYPALYAVAACLQRVAVANLVLAVFNMIPGFPLDGGRVLRSLLWYHWGDLLRATRVASIMGQLVGFALAALGVFLAIASQALWVAAFYIAMGLMLAGVARQSYQRERVRAILMDTAVSQIAAPPRLVLDGATALASAASGFMGPGSPGWAPVLVDGHLRGVLTAQSFGALHPEGWTTTPVSAVMTPLTEAMVVRGREAAGVALRQMADTGLPELLVLDDLGRLTGVVSQDGVRGLLEGPGGRGR